VKLEENIDEYFYKQKKGGKFMKKKIMKEGRKCIVCGAVLSIYNKKNKCFCHDDVAQERFVGSLCTSGICGQRFRATLFQETGKWRED
jgi:hypothetical protein